jgi:multiple sugar transport system ATP-binding protein
LHDRLGATTVFVTHDQNEAMALADHIVVMNKGEIIQADTPEGIYHYPKTKFVANFIGRPPMNFLAITGGVAKGASNIRLGGATVVVPEVLANSDDAVLGIRPEHVQLSDAGVLRGRVVHSEYFGSHWIVSVDTPVGNIKVQGGKQECPAEGTNVGLAFNTKRAVLFDNHSEMLLPSVTTVQHQAGMHHG